MKIKGTFTPVSGAGRPVKGYLCPHQGSLTVFHQFYLTIMVDGFDPIYTDGFDQNEISVLSEKGCKFTIDYGSDKRDVFGNAYSIDGNAVFSSEHSEGEGSGTRVWGIRYETVHLRIFILEGIGNSRIQTGTMEITASVG